MEIPQSIIIQLNYNDLNRHFDIFFIVRFLLPIQQSLNDDNDDDEIDFIAISIHTHKTRPKILKKKQRK